MRPFDLYKERIVAHGGSQRGERRQRAMNTLSRKLPQILSYFEVEINGEPRSLAIVDGDGLDTKNIYSMPGEEIIGGSLVFWENYYWLVIEISARDEIYTKAVMQQCNYLLKWINNENKIIERWSIVVDGTKYLIGEKAGSMATIGDARIAITVAKDAETAKIERGRRFLVDDPDASETLAYQITKSNRLFSIYEGDGVYRYILNEVNLTDADNTELMIADYYSTTGLPEYGDLNETESEGWL